MMESEEERAERWERSSHAMDDLARANARSNATMLNLVEEVRNETKARDRKIEIMESGAKIQQKLVYLVLLSVMVLLALAVANAYNLAQTKSQQDDIQQINSTLLDCVNSRGECGRANAQTQDRLLDEVKKYNLIGFYCIRNNPAADDPEAQKFLACMAELYPGGPNLTELLKQR